MFTDQAVLPKELESPALVRFQDCDPFGHLNNARYIDYFMNARSDQLREHYNFDIFGWGKEIGESWVVSKTQIAYVWPAALMEEVRIRTRLIHADQSKLVVEGVMLDEAGKHVKAVSWVEFTYINMQTGRGTKHPEDLERFLKSVEVEGIYGASDFDQRVAEIKADARQRTRQQGQQ